MPTQNESDVNEILARIDMRTELMADDVGTLKHVLLEGNGVPAITTQVATLNAKVANIEELARDQRIPRGISLGIVLSTVVGIAALIVALIVGFK